VRIPVKRSLARSLPFYWHLVARGVLTALRRDASIDGRIGAQTESSALTSFDGFGLDDAITRTIAEEEHATSTPIQAPTVPVVMSRRDVIVMRLMNSPATSSKRIARPNELQGHRKEADNVQDS
jgi:hypothetical protein